MSCVLVSTAPGTTSDSAGSSSTSSNVRPEHRELGRQPGDDLAGHPGSPSPAHSSPRSRSEPGPGTIPSAPSYPTPGGARPRARSPRAGMSVGGGEYPPWSCHRTHCRQTPSPAIRTIRRCRSTRPQPEEPEELSEAERDEVVADLADLAVYQALLEARGVRGIVVDCGDCGEQHFHEWSLLRASLQQLLEEGQMRPHEPAFDPDPAELRHAGSTAAATPTRCSPTADRHPRTTTAPSRREGAAAVVQLSSRSPSRWRRSLVPRRSPVPPWSSVLVTPPCALSRAPGRLAPPSGAGWSARTGRARSVSSARALVLCRAPARCGALVDVRRGRARAGESVGPSGPGSEAARRDQRLARARARVRTRPAATPTDRPARPPAAMVGDGRGRRRRRRAPATSSSARSDRCVERRATGPRAAPAGSRPAFASRKSCSSASSVCPSSRGPPRSRRCRPRSSRAASAGCRPWPAPACAVVQPAPRPEPRPPPTRRARGRATFGPPHSVSPGIGVLASPADTADRQPR